MQTAEPADPRLADRSWIQVASGRPFWPLDPRPEDVQIDDIATALSRLPRFTGHTRGDVAYSVAQHSVLVSRTSAPGDRLWGLLHDASEAYLADVPAPLKCLPEFEPYRRIEAAVMRAVCQRFGLPLEEPQSVRMADRVILATEARDLMGDPPWGWEIVSPGKRMAMRIYPETEKDSRREFLATFWFLMDRRAEDADR